MPPQTPPPSLPPRPHQQVPSYDFILNPEQPKRPLVPFGFGNKSTTSRLLPVGAGAVVLIVLLVIVKSLLGGGGSAIPYMVSIAQDQHELLHLATNGTQNVTDGSLKNFAYTAQLSLTSQQQQMVSYLKLNGRKLSSKELALKISPSTDSQLASALANSSYDPTFKSTMQKQLQAYEQDLRTAYLHEKGPKGRAQLNDDYNAADLLLKQLGS